MTQAYEKLSQVQFEHLLWHNELHNYLLEIEIYKSRIQSLMDAESDDEMHNNLRTFRDDFLKISKIITDETTIIGDHEYRIMEVAKLNGAAKLLTNSQHDDMRRKVIRLRKSMSKLKENFQNFSTKHI